MTETARPERYWLTYTFAVGLTAIVALYGAWGWFSVNEPFKAVLCLVAQGLANGNAVLARRAFSKERTAMGIGAVLLGSGCAAWSAVSLHHAWTMDGSEIHWAMTAFLALLEPVMFWFVEEVKLARKPKTAEELADEALQAHRASEPAQRRASLRTITGGLTGAAVAATPTIGQAIEPGHANEPVKLDSPVVKRLTKTEMRAFEPDRAQAKLLLSQGLTPYAVHKVTNVPLSTLKRWAKAA